MKNNTTCFNCTDRHVGCHADCEKYNAWKDEHISENKKLHDAKYKEYQFMGLCKERKTRRIRRERNSK